MATEGSVNVIVPEVTVTGSPKNINSSINVAKYRAASVDHDARPLAYCYRELREGQAHLKWLKDEPRTWERFCAEALGYDAAFLDAVEAGVSVLEGDGIAGRIPGADAYAAGDRVLAAAHVTFGPSIGQGERGPAKKVAEGGSFEWRPGMQAVRAAKNGISPRSQQRLDRLAARFPALMARVRAGEISAAEADRIASGRPKRAMVTLEATRLAEELRQRLLPEQIRELVALLAETTP
jgi:hypothetical protein